MPVCGLLSINPHFFVLSWMGLCSLNPKPPNCVFHTKWNKTCLLLSFPADTPSLALVAKRVLPFMHTWVRPQQWCSYSTPIFPHSKNRKDFVDSNYEGSLGWNMLSEAVNRKAPVIFLLAIK